jgi:hypothetical protein
MSDVFNEAPVVETTPAQQENADAQAQTQQQVPNNQQVFEVEYKGKTWKAEDVLNKFTNADSYIEQLKAENEQLKSKVTKETNMQQVLDAINQQQTVQNTTAVAPEAPVVNNAPDLETVAANVFRKLQTEQQVEANVSSMSQKAAQLFGDKATEVLQNKGAELGMSMKEIRDLAGTKPKVFEQLFLASGKQEPTTTPTKGSVNTQALNPQQSKGTVRASQAKSGKDLAALALSKLKSGSF